MLYVKLRGNILHHGKGHRVIGHILKLYFYIWWKSSWRHEVCSKLRRHYFFNRVVVLSFRYLKRKKSICHYCDLALYETLQSQVNISVCYYDAPWRLCSGIFLILIIDCVPDPFPWLVIMATLRQTNHWTVTTEASLNCLVGGTERQIVT